MIEEEFMQMAIDEFNNADLSGDDADEKIMELVTRLQTAAYARGKMDSTTESIESLPQPSVFPTVIFPEDTKVEPATTVPDYEPNIGNYISGRSIACFDCGLLIEEELMPLHFGFHSAINDAAGVYVTGYSEDE